MENKRKVTIDGILFNDLSFYNWERGKLFIHGDNEPEAIINTKGKTAVVDIKGIEKYFEEMERKESGNAENKG